MKRSRLRSFGHIMTALRALALPVFFAIAVAVTPRIAHGCPMCEAAIEGAKDQLGRGLNVSIAFLMSMPFVLVGSVGAWLFYMKRRGRGRASLLRALRIQKEEVS
jgi:hypothetical protein